MRLNARLVPWSGKTYRHLAEGYAPLDFSRAGQGADNRWNEPGEPTLYLASTIGLLGIEFFRHFEQYRTLALRHDLRPRAIYRYDITLEHLLDLTDPEVWQAIAIDDDAPRCWDDIPVARATARYLRATTQAQALRVPSMGKIQGKGTVHVGEWNLVVFLDRLPADLAAILAAHHLRTVPADALGDLLLLE